MNFNCKIIMIITAIALSSNMFGSIFDREAMIIDTTIVSVPGYGEQRQPAIAWGNNNGLIAYAEFRHGNPRIYGVRFDDQGNILDPLGIIISWDLIDQQTPDIAFDGSNFMVVWRGYIEDSSYGYAGIYAKRISQGGVILDSDPIEITHSNLCANPRIIFMDSIYLVLWVANSNQLKAARISTSGNVLDPAGIHVTTTWFPDIALSADSNNFMIMWSKGGSITSLFVSRIDHNGMVLDTNGVMVSQYTDHFGKIYPAGAYDGVNHLFVWQTYNMWGDSIPKHRIVGRRIDVDANVLDSVDILMTPDAGSYNRYEHPDIVFNGINYLITWENTDNSWPYGYIADIGGRRVDTNGMIIDTIPLSISNEWAYETDIRMTAGTNLVFIVWEDARNSTQSGWELDEKITDLYMCRVDSRGQVLDTNGIRIAPRLDVQRKMPRVASNNDDYFVVWDDHLTADVYRRDHGFYMTDVYGIRIDEYGQAIDSIAFQISSDSLMGYGYGHVPDIACSDENYMIVWNQFYFNNYPWYGLAARRYAFDGTVIDTNIIELGDPCWSRPSILFNNRDYLVSLTKHITGTNCSILTWRIDPNGTIHDQINVDQIALGFSEQNLRSVHGDSLSVIAYTSFDPNSYTVAVRCKRLSDAGVLLDTMPIIVSEDSLCYIQDIDVAFDGNCFMIAFIYYYRFSFLSSRVCAKRVDQNGVVIDSLPIVIADNTNYKDHICLEYDGRNYIAVWNEISAHQASDLYGARISPYGFVIDHFDVCTEQYDQWHPFLIRSASDSMFLFYSGVLDSIGSRPAYIERILARKLYTTGVEENPPATDRLLSVDVSPNPFSKALRIRFHGLGIEENNIGIKIYDITGSVVRKIMPGKGITEIIWKGDDRRGRKLPAGIYFCELSLENNRKVQKVILLK